MFFSKKDADLEKPDVSEKIEELDLKLRAVEDAISRLERAHRDLLKAIKRADQSRALLQSSMAEANRRGK